MATIELRSRDGRVLHKVKKVETNAGAVLKLCEASRIRCTEDVFKLFGVDLREAKFGGVTLHNVSFESADLRRVVLRAANLQNVDFGNAQLQGAYFTSATVARCNFSRTEAYGAKFIYAKLVGCDFARANLPRVSFANADISDTWFDHANLENAQFGGARLNWASHDLLAEILRQEAGADMKKRQIAGLLYVSRDMCWDAVADMKKSKVEWALRHLAKWAWLRPAAEDGKERELEIDENAPKIVKQYTE